MKLSREFYKRDARIVAQELLGKILVHYVNGEILKGIIVETEAYIGSIDKACHAYGGRRTKKIEPLYGEGGISYVYFIYGMYFCFNVITGQKDEPEGVLIRAVKPIEGKELMALNRCKNHYEALSKKQIINLTSGPSKLCMAFNINMDCNMKDMCTDDEFYIEENLNNINNEIIADKRIGIDYAGEARDFLWRYYIKGNPFVSS